MDEYFFPVGTLKAYARKEIAPKKVELLHLQEELEPGECLVGHYRVVSDLKEQSLAPLLSDRQFHTFEHLTEIGEAVCLGYFVVDQDTFHRFSSARKGKRLVSGFC